jgi:hypothetical protein
VSSFSFDVDNRETVYLAYAVTNTGQAAVLRHDQEGWQNAGNKVIAGGTAPGLPATEVSLAISGDDVALLAFVDHSRENRISVYELAAETWQPLDFPGISPPEARAPQLQVSPCAVTVCYLTGPEDAATIGITRLPRR